MDIIFSFLLVIIILAACLLIHFKFYRLKNVCDYEKLVAERMQARAHRIVAARIDIDLMPQSFQKLSAHDDWLDAAYEYREDYELGVAEEMKKSKFSGVKAYGGIKLVS